MINSTEKISKYENRPEHPEEKANFLSKISFWWLIDLFKYGLHNDINESDIYQTRDRDLSENLWQIFRNLWSKEIENGTNNLWRVIRKVFGWKIFLFGLLYSIVDSFCRILQPQCLGGLVLYFSQGEEEAQISKAHAYYYAFGIILCSFIPTLVFHPFFLYLINIGLRVRTACCSLLYEKVLKFKKSAPIDGLNGQLINLMTNDAAKVDAAVSFFHDIYKGPIEAFLLGYFIFREIGVGGLLGVALIICFIPLQIWISKKSAMFRLKTSLRTDNRVRLMNEIIQGIQIIKMYTWEQSFAKIINKIRCKEVDGVRGTLYLRAVIESLDVISKLSIFLSLVSFLYFGNVFTASKIFIVTCYFNLLYTSMLQFWPYALSDVAVGFVSIRRIQKFLIQDETITVPKNFEDEKIAKDETDVQDKLLLKTIPSTNTNLPKRLINVNLENKGVFFRNASAYWSESDRKSNNGVFIDNLEFKNKGLHAIVGQIGTGKSTILQTILGELELDKGEIEINGTICYASQEPWIFQGTIRRNIIFNEDYNYTRYKEITKICELDRDISLFPHEDQTVVGEKGATLSGGQKARINLARCLYKEADIYLLDDVFSAVDVRVGNRIFDQCIKRFLKNKICVLVTHQLQYLKDADNIILLNDGYVASQGTFKDLKSTKNFSILTQSSNTDGNSNAGDDNENGNKNIISFANQKKQQIITNIVDDSKENKVIEAHQKSKLKHSNINHYHRQENQIIGKVGFDVYKGYLRSVDNMMMVAFVGLLFILAQLATSGVDYFIAQWVNQEEKLAQSSNNNENNDIHLLNLDTYRHNNSIETSSSPSKNITIINQNDWINRQNYIYFYSIFTILAFYLTIHRSFAFFKMFLRASINLHDRLFESITRATMWFFNNNTSGRILNRCSRDIGVIDTLLPVALVNCVMFFLRLISIVILVAIVNYWLLLPTFFMSLVLYGLRYIYINTARSLKRIESLTRSPIYSHVNATFQGLPTIHSAKAEKLLINEFHLYTDMNTSAQYLYFATTRALALWLELVCVAYISVVTLSFLLFSDKSSTTGGNVGLAISQVLNMVFFCQWGIRQTAELESLMVSFERIQEYIDIPPEPPLKTPNKCRPDKVWPSNGRIIFENFYLRYSADGDYVLKDLNFKINPTEKLGIIGRTGAGKSSIVQALFRFALNEGRILIDDIDIATLGLQDLRAVYSIIPQDPVLFSGTVRSNLDPFDEKTDCEMWDALEQVELKHKISLMSDGLNSKITDGGSNFSMGERQLICLARAILKKNKILILDEATANVDQETDYLIQETIHQKFSQCTVLIIAHRLHTIMDSDKVLVLDEGRITEFGHPYELIQNSRGNFRKLVDKTGLSTSIELIKIAEKSYFTKRK